MKTFLITGYPRSRTAWLANLLSSGPALCLHDPYAYCDPLAFARSLGPTVEYFGVSDSGLGLMGAAVLGAWREAPLLVVDRPREEALRSFVAYAKSLGLSEERARIGFDAVADARDRLVRSRRHLAIPFEALAESGEVERLWRHLVPGLPFNATRWEVLSRLHITTSFGRR